MALTFSTYGSTSHDLVHRSLGLPRAANEALLCVIELRIKTEKPGKCLCRRI